MVLNTDWAQVEVIDLINDGTGLAFGIIGGRSTGVVVKTILPGGVADRDGRLQSGDHILQIGEVNLRGLGSEQVASVLRQCGIHVRMVVARPIESTSSDYQQTLGSHAPIVPTKILGDPVELDKHLVQNGYGETSNYRPPITSSMPSQYFYTSLQLHGAVDVVVKNPQPIGQVPTIIQSAQPVITNMLPLDMALHEPNLPETETFAVNLQKDDLGLGITVAGYVCEREEISGIFVKSISKGSAADIAKRIKINDRIVEVDGISVVGHTNHQAVELLRSTGPLVTIKFERYLRGPKYEQLQQAIRANELRLPSPPSPTASSLPKVPLSLVQMTYLGVEPEGESRTSFDFDSSILLTGDVNDNNANDQEEVDEDEEQEEIVIDCRRSIQFSICSNESINDKWRRKVGDDVAIVIAEMHKEATSGLGISLEGTVEVEDGKELHPHHYIRNILPDGPVGKNGVLQSGDELLEVNGIQLLGLNHLEVVAILKQLPDVVCLVCARYQVPIRIIDTSQCREAFQARKIFAGSLQTLIPHNDRMVKAKSETSLASSYGSGHFSNKSKSLEILAGLPIWSTEPTVVELHKADCGLGFSILDYQDPLNPQQTVIVIRSLVPGSVAQISRQLIPGDRLLAVNDVNVEHESLDRAVQVLKGAPKGVVRITVAKPLNSNDGVSQASQDTEDDQTCLDDDFQECIEEYQECLEVVHISIDGDDNSFNHSNSCTSQVEDLGGSNTNNKLIINNLNNKLLLCQDSSDLDLSYKSTNDHLNNKICFIDNHNLCESANKPSKTDSLTQSDKVSLNQDGYETCMDESLSEEAVKNNNQKNTIKEDDIILITPTNSRLNLIHNQCVDKIRSEPCLTSLNPVGCRNHLFLETPRHDDELKSYDSHSTGPDEFFLVQFPDHPEESSNFESAKSSSEPSIFINIAPPKKVTYRLEEYYNDYEECLESYKVLQGSNNVEEEEICEAEEIFCGGPSSFLTAKSGSAPDITDSSFVTLTYDPGPGTRRKSDFSYVKSQSGEQNAPPMTVIRSSLSGGVEKEEDTMLQKHWSGTQTVRVFREPNTSLGISIVGGKVDLQSSDAPTKVLGIFIKNVVPNSPAGRTGKFKIGDRILEVSGVDLSEASHEKAVDAIRNASSPVVFVVQSLIPWKYENEAVGLENAQPLNNSHLVKTDQPSSAAQQENNYEIPQITVSNGSGGAKNATDAEIDEDEPATAPSDEPIKDLNGRLEEGDKITALASSPVGEVYNYQPDRKVSASPNEESFEESDDDEEDVRDLEGRTTLASGHQIDRASAGNLKRSQEEAAADPEDEDDFGYTTNKVKKKYSSLGHTILMVQLERSSQGLGLSLAGHKDRNCMAVFVCGLNPNGAAYKTGGIQIGDEILEVNGVVLHGRCHLNASAIIKGLSGPIFKVIILRRTTAIDDIAVKPITQFPVSLAEEASEEQFSASYPNVRTVAVKKGHQSLGIMIIEGKHAEVGQGIFISDIQDGSPAEKAGLEIGEMILAVNKDSLVGSNYDTAANLLKRTEGLVTLVVSNPGKKDQKQQIITENSVGGKGGTLKPLGPPSRPSTPVPEPPADPATCAITPGKEVTIEVLTDNKGLGIFFVGGKDTLLPNGIVLVEIYPGGKADKDNRLRPGDQILEVNGTSLKEVTSSSATQTLRQTLPKMKLVVFRPEKIDYTKLDIDLLKKPGKGLGLSVIARKAGKGVYVFDILSGGVADIDGRLMRGDLLVSVNGQNVESAGGEEAGAILKTATGKISLKLHRYKTR